MKIVYSSLPLRNKKYECWLKKELLLCIQFAEMYMYIVGMHKKWNFCKEAVASAHCIEFCMNIAHERA
jgi:hypothetical protein